MAHEYMPGSTGYKLYSNFGILGSRGILALPGALTGSSVAPHIRGLDYQDTTATGALGHNVAKAIFADVEPEVQEG
jgi:hypothetical protein